MQLNLLLGLMVALLVTGLYAVTAFHRAACSRTVYGVALTVCTFAFLLALAHLAGATTTTLNLPLGLP